MVDIGVASAWIAISALSAIGLSTYARAVAARERRSELERFPLDAWAGPQDAYVIGAYRPVALAHR
jgi:hypothetical protein